MSFIQTFLQYPGLFIILACAMINIGVAKWCYDQAFPENEEKGREKPPWSKANAVIGFTANILIFALNFFMLLNLVRELS